MTILGYTEAETLRKLYAGAVCLALPSSAGAGRPIRFPGYLMRRKRPRNELFGLCSCPLCYNPPTVASRTAVGAVE